MESRKVLFDRMGWIVFLNIEICTTSLNRSFSDEIIILNMLFKFTVMRLFMGTWRQYCADSMDRINRSHSIFPGSQQVSVAKYLLFSLWSHHTSFTVHWDYFWNTFLGLSGTFREVNTRMWCHQNVFDNFLYKWKGRKKRFTADLSKNKT